MREWVGGWVVKGEEGVGIWIAGLLWPSKLWAGAGGRGDVIKSCVLTVSGDSTNQAGGLQLSYCSSTGCEGSLVVARVGWRHAASQRCGSG